MSFANIFSIDQSNLIMIRLSIIITIGVVILIIALLLYLAGKCCHRLPYYGMTTLTSPMISYRSSMNNDNMSIDSEIVLHSTADIDSGPSEYIQNNDKKFVSLCDTPEYTPRPQVMLT